MPEGNVAVSILVTENQLLKHQEKMAEAMGKVQAANDKFAAASAAAAAFAGTKWEALANKSLKDVQKELGNAERAHEKFASQAERDANKLAAAFRRTGGSSVGHIDSMKASTSALSASMDGIVGKIAGWAAGFLGVSAIIGTIKRGLSESYESVEKTVGSIRSQRDIWASVSVVAKGDDKLNAALTKQIRDLTNTGLTTDRAAEVVLGLQTKGLNSGTLPDKMGGVEKVQAILMTLPDFGTMFKLNFPNGY